MAKKDVAGYETYARQVVDLFGEHPEVLEDVLDGLFHIAKADDVMHDNELEFLHEVAQIFGLKNRFRCIKARHIYSGQDDPYTVLDVDPCSSDVELKRHYRKVVKENHPDRHIAAGLPPEMITIANERLAAITQAWESIVKERSM
jgi:DnaJ like chaperone protein